MSVNMVPIIEKKKFGEALSTSEINAWVDGLSDGSVPDYQSAALLMAIRLKGMNFDETLALTRAMTDSGDRLTFDGYPVLADKHSTGGVGDKVTLILAPMLAACGVPVTMLSGRGLGFSGGTIDKFEAVSGVRCEWDNTGMQKMLDEFGWTNAQASKSIAPADRVLYALRDVTGTVDSIPLITASILSKKIAGGATHLCLDVKCGRSAFMTDLKMARKLADNLAKIGSMDGMSVEGLISRMDEPLGHAIGNYLELMESVAYLRVRAQTPLMDLVWSLACKMLLQTGFATSAADAEARLGKVLSDGSALGKLYDYLQFCGASDEELTRLDEARFEKLPHVSVKATRSGFVSGIHGRAIGELLIELGAGRKKQDDVLDPLAGLTLQKHLGDRVEAGETLALVFGDRRNADFVTSGIDEAIQIGDDPYVVSGIVLDSF